MFSKTSQFHHKQDNSNLKSGFTIVELLVVIVVIAILAAIIIVSYTGMTQKAVIATLQSDLKNASTQLEIDKVINANYPTYIGDANDGKGLKSSTGVILTYNHDNDTDNYCLMAVSTNATSYYINSDTKVPTEGTCHVFIPSK